MSPVGPYNHRSTSASPDGVEQQINTFPGGWWRQWKGVIVDSSSDHCALAGMAHACAARPLCGTTTVRKRRVPRVVSQDTSIEVCGVDPLSRSANNSVRRSLLSPFVSIASSWCATCARSIDRNTKTKENEHQNTDGGNVARSTEQHWPRNRPLAGRIRGILLLLSFIVRKNDPKAGSGVAVG